MGSGFTKMKKQAKMLQDQMQSMQKQMEETEETGSAGSGLVSITLKGDKSITSISIKPDCVDKDDIEGLEDLIMAAYSEAFAKIESKLNAAGTGGMPFPF